MWSSSFVGHVHRRPSHRRYWVCWSSQRRNDNHFYGPPNTETGAFYGTQYGYGAAGSCDRAHHWRRIYYKCVLAVVYVIPFLTFDIFPY
jgi:hypothetical protein